MPAKYARATINGTGGALRTLTTMPPRTPTSTRSKNPAPILSQKPDRGYVKASGMPAGSGLGSVAVALKDCGLLSKAAASDALGESGPEDPPAIAMAGLATG